MKKMFTLIELIIVIVILGILAAIVVPNISNFQEEANTTAIVSDGKNIQTTVDIYSLKNNNKYPIEDGSTLLGEPKPIIFGDLYPNYLRDVPQFEGMYYWIDYQGVVWYSRIDNPKDFLQGDSSLTWTSNENASGYNIYEVTDGINSTATTFKFKLVDEVDSGIEKSIPENYDKNKTYLISVIDNLGFEAAPVKQGYKGSSPFHSDYINQIPVTPEQEELISNPRNKLYSGDYHTLILKENNELWGFGYNYFGQLGTAVNNHTNNPIITPVKIMDNVRFVSADTNHTLVITENNELWTFGWNRDGQLGHSENTGTMLANPTPKKIMEHVRMATGGSYHTVVVTENSELWTFGRNDTGQLGHDKNLGTTEAYPTPTKVMENVLFADAGRQHTSFIDKNKSLWSFGSNLYGQLGTSINSGTDTPTITPVKSMDGIKYISSGARHVLALTETNELWTFGNNLYGEIGRNTNGQITNPIPTKIMNSVSAISAGSYHSLVLNHNNQLFTFGYNYYGQLGTTVNNKTGNVNSTPIKIMDNISHIASGGHSSIVLNKNNQYLTFGWNKYGQLGRSDNIGTENPNPNPTEIMISN